MIIPEADTNRLVIPAQLPHLSDQVTEQSGLLGNVLLPPLPAESVLEEELAAHEDRVFVGGLIGALTARQASGNIAPYDPPQVDFLIKALMAAPTPALVAGAEHALLQMPPPAGRTDEPDNGGVSSAELSLRATAEAASRSDPAHTRRIHRQNADALRTTYRMALVRGDQEAIGLINTLLDGFDLRPCE